MNAGHTGICPECSGGSLRIQVSIIHDSPYCERCGAPATEVRFSTVEEVWRAGYLPSRCTSGAWQWSAEHGGCVGTMKIPRAWYVHGEAMCHDPVDMGHRIGPDHTRAVLDALESARALLSGLPADRAQNYHLHRAFSDVQAMVKKVADNVCTAQDAEKGNP